MQRTRLVCCSCKLLGQDREVRMWESENQVNTVIIQPSPAMEAEILASMQKELEEERDPVEQDAVV